MNKVDVVRDEENEVYLKVYDKGNDIYFRIEEFTTEPTGKIINLGIGLLLLNLRKGA